MADRFFIGPFDKDGGLKSNVRPWLLPNNAFAELNNAFIFRERVKKRFGSRWIGNDQLGSRLRIRIGTTNGAGATPANTFVPRIKPALTIPVAPIAIGQMFSVGTEVFTVNNLTNPWADLLYTQNATLARINIVTGELQLAGCAINTDIYYYPSLPVLGLPFYETYDLNNERLLGFDSKFCYENFGNGWDRISAEAGNNDSIFDGASDHYFPWIVNWRGVNATEKYLFLCNGNSTETNYMRMFDGTTWSSFRPDLGGNKYIDNCAMLVAYQGRLLALAPWVNGVQHQNEVYYSAHHDPMPTTGWKQDVIGKGNSQAASTNEAMIACKMLKDQLVVKFERSTRILRYSGNDLNPFYWETINSEMGCESTFAMVPFDKVVLTVGDSGITADNTMSVDRIDAKIPDELFKIHNYPNGPKRVYGIRDYTAEVVYWAFPDNTRSSSYPHPNRVLVYNYKNGNWAFNDDSFTCFGYRYDQTATGVTWDSDTVTWDSEVTWDDGSVSPRSKNIIAGNQQGYTVIIDSDGLTTNAPALQITDITSTVTDNFVITCINHNLKSGDYIYIQDLVNDTTDPLDNLTILNNRIFSVNVLTPNTFTLGYTSIPDSSDPAHVQGTYYGNGTISRVSQISIRTKDYNFYVTAGRNMFASKVNFLVDRTDGGEITVDYFTNATYSLPAGSVKLETYAYPTVPQETYSERLWHPIYIQAQGESIQLRLYFNDSQMLNNNVRIAPFQLNAFIVEAVPSSNNLS